MKFSTFVFSLELIVVIVENFEVSNSIEGGREKRYVVRGKRWKKHKFVWQLEPQNLLDSDIYIVRNTLHRAFNEWSSVSSLEFQEIPPEVRTTSSTKPDILIAFEKGNHKDGYPFDGKDGIVAHAFYPRDGRLHFDAEERWSLNTREGVNLFQTAVHEIGHLLGLEHSVDSRAAMFASKRPYDPTFSIGDDDVRAIRALFPIKQKENLLQKPINIQKIETTTTTTEPTTTTEFFEEEHADPFDLPSSPTNQAKSSFQDSFFPFPLPSLEHFQRRNDWFVL